LLQIEHSTTLESDMDFKQQDRRVSAIEALYRRRSDSPAPGLSNAGVQLTQLTDALTTHGDVQSLLENLSDIVAPIIQFDTVSVMLYDADIKAMRGYAADTDSPTSFRTNKEYALNDCPQGTVWRTQQPLQIADLRRDERFPHSKRLIKESGLRSYWVLPLTTAREALGALAFGSHRLNGFSDCDTQAMLRVARIVALAVESSVNAVQCEALHRRTAQQRDQLATLLEITNTLVAARGLDALLRNTSACLQRLVKHDAASLNLFDPVTGDYRVMAFDEQMNGRSIARFIDRPAAGSALRQLLETRAPMTREQLDISEFPDDPTVARVVSLGFVSICSVPILGPQRVIGVLSMGRRRREPFTADEVELLTQTGRQLVLAVENAVALDEIRSLKEGLIEENRYLTEEIRAVHRFDEIVGHSTALQKVLDQVRVVAPTDSTVLIEGETGTGKELIARAIHDRSARCERPLIKVNCAAIPAGLIESELFGHEKGAFTGAIAQRKGKFELANGGTIFLDEIGEMPLSMQTRLLRALQEREIERVGGSKTIALDVRVIAATNVDLFKRVANHEFRADLYYRLAVFPLHMPPLRERRGDIGLLVSWFTEKLSRSMHKRIDEISAETLQALESYDWPGNVRELENVIERAVILSRGSSLEVPLSALPAGPRRPSGDDALEVVEREHMLRVLAECKWVLSGPKGAATRLGLKRTTLQSRMERMGIARPI
jgi:formate hydrogenlyase transcriptional activator